MYLKPACKRVCHRHNMINAPDLLAFVVSKPARVCLCCTIDVFPHTECRFSGLLRELDADKAALGIQSYGLSSTTLEEVFLKVSSLGEAGGRRDQDGPNPSETRIDVAGSSHTHESSGAEAKPRIKVGLCIIRLVAWSLLQRMQYGRWRM